MRSSEKWGVDVETAVGLALKDLKLERDEVEVEVLEESSSGFLGIGSKLARVRVTAKEDKGNNVKEKATFDDIDAILAGLPENSSSKLPDEVRAEYDKYEAEEREDARAREKAHAKSRKNSKSSKNKKYDLSVEDSMLYEVKKLDPVQGHPVEAFLRDIADKMGIDLDFSVKAGEELVFVEITGKDTGTIIGKRGATLDAVQCLASYVVNKENGKYTRVILDAENYRSKREKTLVNLANRLAGKVERTRHSVTLEPMNPYESKVINCTLQNHPKVKTRSEGKDPYRKVIIELK
ncbi:MAG: Jag N-terminal domain-containing protein [Mogibacterium sp.]|nr:Jag N-terminal domain-containing protein [Mogibacterium sp.]